MAIKISDLNILDNLTLARGDTIPIVTHLLDVNDKPYNLKNFNIKIGLKLLKDIKYGDEKLLYSMNEKDSQIEKTSDGYISFIIPADVSMNFPVTKSNNPIILSIIIYNKQHKYRKEFHYKLNIKYNVINKLY